MKNQGPKKHITSHSLAWELNGNVPFTPLSYSSCTGQKTNKDNKGFEYFLWQLENCTNPIDLSSPATSFEDARGFCLDVICALCQGAHQIFDEMNEKDIKSIQKVLKRLGCINYDQVSSHLKTNNNLNYYNMKDGNSLVYPLKLLGNLVDKHPSFGSAVFGYGMRFKNVNPYDAPAPGWVLNALKEKYGKNCWYVINPNQYLTDRMEARLMSMQSELQQEASMY